MPSLNSGCRLVNGFTLVELMITLAVAVVVLTIGLPSFRSLQLNNERTARMNELLGSLSWPAAR